MYGYGGEEDTRLNPENNFENLQNDKFSRALRCAGLNGMKGELYKVHVMDGKKEERGSVVDVNDHGSEYTLSVTCDPYAGMSGCNVFMDAKNLIASSPFAEWKCIGICTWMKFKDQKRIDLEVATEIVPFHKKLMEWLRDYTARRNITFRETKIVEEYRDTKLRAPSENLDARLRAKKQRQ
eukprot:UN30690